MPNGMEDEGMSSVDSKKEMVEDSDSADGEASTEKQVSKELEAAKDANEGTTPEEGDVDKEATDHAHSKTSGVQQETPQSDKSARIDGIKQGKAESIENEDRGEEPEMGSKIAAEDGGDIKEVEEVSVKKEGQSEGKLDPEHKDEDSHSRRTHIEEQNEPGKNQYMPPNSPSQVPPHIPYGNQGYMTLYGHPIYHPYGYPPHYPQHPYYPGYPYPPHSQIIPPHMMSAPPIVHPGYPNYDQVNSPGRRHSAAPYHPYPPASPVVSPTSAAPYGHNGADDQNKSTPPRTHRKHHQGVLGEAMPTKGHGKSIGDGDLSEDMTGTGAVPMCKVYVKPSGQASEEVLARRARKNAQSRARATKHRQRIAEIERKPESERTEEEIQIYETHQERRQRKNDRSRERALEKKDEIDKILAKPVNKRSRIELQFLETALGAKKRKNEGDRLRRTRLKELGLSPKGSSKPGIPARGPLPEKYLNLLNQKGQDSAHHAGHDPYMSRPPHGYGGHPVMPPEHHEDPHASNSRTFYSL